jgi:hypothetical protein
MVEGKKSQLSFFFVCAFDHTNNVEGAGNCCPYLGSTGHYHGQIGDGWKTGKDVSVGDRVTSGR